MSRNSTNSTAQIILSIIIVVIVIGVVPSIISVMNHSIETNVGAPSDVETASYIIYQDGDYTCVKNGTTGRIESRNDNSTTVIQSVLDIGGKIVVLPGDYQIASTLNIHGETQLIGMDANFYAPSTNFYMFTTDTVTSDDFTGDNTSISDAFTNSISITVTEAHDLDVGDYCYITSTSTWKNTVVVPGEIKKITAISGTSIYFDQNLITDYLAADNARIYAIDMDKNLTISGLNLIGRSAIDGISRAINIYNVENLHIYNVKITDFGNAGLMLYNIRDSVIETIKTSGLGNNIVNGYGIALMGSCSNVIIKDSVFSNGWHGHTTGQLAYGGIPSYITFSNVVFSNTSSERPHEPGTHLYYHDCRWFNTSLVIENPFVYVDGGAMYCKNSAGIYIGQQGRHTNTNNITISNLYINGTGASVITIRNAQNVEINNIKIDHYFGVTASGYAIDIYPITSAGLVANTIANVTIKNSEINSNCRGLKVYGTVNTQVIKDLTIENNLFPIGIGVLISNEFAKRIKFVGNTIWSTAIGLDWSKSDGAYIDGNVIVSGSTYGLYYTPRGDNSTITNNRITGGTTSVPAAIVYGNAGSKKGVIFSGNQIVSKGNYYGIFFRTITNSTITNNVVINENTNYPIALYSDTADIKVSGNVLMPSSGVGKVLDSGKRNVINGVGTNGANDPASAGNWAGFGYEGVLVKWNNGATHYLSVYSGTAWYDMTLA